MTNKCDNLLNLIKNQNSSVGDIRLKSANYNANKNCVDVAIVTDGVVSLENSDYISSIIEKQMGVGVKVNVELIKSICDGALAKKAIYNYLEENCYSISHLISKDDVHVISANKKVIVELTVSQTVLDFLNRTNEIENMTERLSRNYSNDFCISTALCSNKVEEFNLQNDTIVPELPENTDRYLKVLEVQNFCDKENYDTAIYIADGKHKLGVVYYAGKITSKERRTYKKGDEEREYYVLTIDDKTGSVSGKFFTRDKNKLKKLEKIDVGSVIILRGQNDLFNGNVSLVISGFHLCEFPKNFTPMEKPSKKAPSNYSLIFPTEVEIATQDNFLSLNASYPQEFLDTEYTVVDIETTGTDVAVDKITEIGAVKIKNGKIAQQFTTLINPQMPIPERIVELTGIDDELVKDKPIIDEVYADFFKFIGNSVFVGHNVEFDFRFLRTAGKSLGYILDNRTLDTLALSRKILTKLSHHKLNQVCDYYGIVFHHHRAMADAYATAELLLELLKGRKEI